MTANRGAPWRGWRPSLWNARRKTADARTPQGELERRELTDKAWLVGGVIPREDRDAARELGFTGVFPTGADFDEIAGFIRENVA